MRVRVFTDSTSDLTDDMLRDMDNMPLLPLLVHMGEDTRHDGVDITPDDMYLWADAHKSTPKTAAPTPEMARAALAACYAQSDDVFFTGISEQLSATAEVIRLAHNDFYPDKRLVTHNSEGVSLKVGMQAMHAHRLAEQGLSLEEMEREMLAYRRRVHIAFIMESTLYLYRGGRCSALTNLGVGLLNIKPSILMKDGLLVPGPRFHGRMGKSVAAFMKHLEPDLRKADKERVYLLESGRVVPEAYAFVEQYLHDVNDFGDIAKKRAGSVISSHCGPGTIGVVYLL